MARIAPPTSIETNARPLVRGYLHGEAALSELLHDPIARALMIADKVDSGVVYELLRAAQRAS
jgi:hypothetical protein